MDGDANAPAALRIAVPNKGSLSEVSTAILAEAGYRQRSDPKQLTCTDAANGVEFFYLRPRDMLVDSGAPAVELMGLGVGRSTFRFAGPTGRYRDVADLAGQRIATSYDQMVRAWLGARGIDATVVRLDGAVESSVQLGVADAIADVVETGRTLREAGLETFGEVVIESEAVVVTRSGELPASFATFQRRLAGVLTARGYVMMDYDVAEAHLDAVVAISPGVESPTIAPLRRSGWFAVRVMVPRRGAQQLMDDLYAAGARGILVTDIAACRL